ncbi:MAG TPA: hypothetical protein LFV66_01400 [Rickettsia endosymbiont of Bembidion lapponicum]|nr:hypothetical protein [Rickettsia endosymbiont of Bembidion lapponicum]
MLNQNSSILSNSSTSDFPKVIAFLQPPYEHNRTCQMVKEDLSKFCKKNNFNLIDAINFENPCDHQALNKLIDLVRCNASDYPITLMINEEMVAKPANVPFWSTIGALAGLKLIKVTAYDYNYLEYDGLFLDNSYLKELNFSTVGSYYFDKHYISSENRANKTHIDKLAQKSILFLQPFYNDESLELRAKLKTYCKNKDYGKLKTIRYTNPYDFTSLYALIRDVKISKVKPARILIDQEIINTPIHKILWIMLDTLLIEGTIEIYVYVQENDTLYIRRLKESEDRLLSSAIFCEKLLNSNNLKLLDEIKALNIRKFIQETARYYDWEEAQNMEQIAA